MANLGGNPVQGSFVGRTRKIDRVNQFTATKEVAASTTYEPTGSFQNTAFFVEAGSKHHKINNDFNGNDQEGVGVYQVTQKNGKRCEWINKYNKWF